MRVRSKRFAALVGSLLLLGGAGAHASALSCIDDFPGAIALPIQIPLGCQLIDCCPGCPADGWLDLRIRLEGAGLGGGQIVVPDKYGKPGRPVPVAPGETVIPDVVRAGATGPAPVAVLQLEPGDSARGAVEIVVEQVLDSIVVNELLSRWTVIPCPDLEPCDRILQTGNTGADRSIHLVDGRRPSPAGCSSDETPRAMETAAIGNLLLNDGCRSEVATFSSENAMALQEAVTTWKDECGDVLNVALDPILEAPATFFFAIPDDLAIARWGKTAAQVAQLDLDRANEIYDANKTGLSFSMEERKLDADDLQEIGALILKLFFTADWTDPVAFVCDLTAGLEAGGYHVPGRLNVYYLPLPGGGMICPTHRNIVYMALGKKPATLAHEFGHSLSLLGQWGHTTNLPGFDEHNVMWTGSGVTRSRFTLGQAFRQNVESISTINTNVVRQGPVRTCPLTASSDACPRLDLDWARP